uniref:Uncharacterized protein n=1 Tax=Avena sativa TaxID=4498 RepID=A0ACD5VK97_AVESA
MRIRSLMWLLATIQAVGTVHAGDEVSLLAFKGQLGDGGAHALASWNASNHFCSWQGVTCSQWRPARVVALNLSSRALTGELSPALGNLTFLRTLNLSFNWFHGEIPASLGRLRRLQRLDLNDNSFSGTFPVNLSSCVSLVEMVLDNNKLHGRIPDELGEKLMSLSGMSLDNNIFTGPIPASLANLSHLQTLYLSNNQLVGSIPPGLGSIRSMQQFSIFSNNISGMLPPSLYNWSSLELLEDYLARNRFSGYVPPTLGKLGALQYLFLADNKLEANDNKGWEFITSLANCSNLERLALGGDSFGGQLPGSIVNLSTTLQKLYLVDSTMYGGIPADIGNLSGLKLLAIANTCMSGVIPENIGKLENLIELGLYNSGFSGHIPSSLGNLSQLNRLYAYNGNLEGTIPASLGELKHLFVLDLSTNRLNGSIPVYKCVLDNEERTLAVKVFNLDQSKYSKSFEVECEAMKRMRHRCLIKIITSCSSVNHQGQEFKALVFEFMPNGNLDDWLHPKSQEPTTNNTLSLAQRLDIAVDIVDAVEYLHNYCQQLVIHCDLKPSNILLADDMSARVGDFGISRIIQENTSEGMQNSYSSIGIRGSIGYVAPEYGEGFAVSPPGDIYSLGILLLEMFIGRRPTDDTFSNSLDLYKFAEDALPDRTLEIADPTLWLHNEQDDNVTSRTQECLVSIFRLGISCSKQQSRDRTLTRDAAAEMHAIRDAYISYVG